MIKMRPDRPALQPCANGKAGPDQGAAADIIPNKARGVAAATRSGEPARRRSAARHASSQNKIHGRRGQALLPATPIRGVKRELLSEILGTGVE
jgi:hypothetical protein